MSIAQIKIERYGERLICHSRAALYWARKRILVISDLHLGKSNHFRKYGVAVPNNGDLNDLKIIEELISHFNPRKVILLGDLFHSTYNQSWEWFIQFTDAYPKGYFILIKGNHDILPELQYYRTKMVIEEHALTLVPFVFSHIPMTVETDLINITGHIHPGVRLRGKGRQSIKLKCFHMSTHQILMPAFGHFTGNAAIKPKPDDLIAAIHDDDIFLINT